MRYAASPISSGRIRRCRAAQRAGATVTLVSGPVELPAPVGVERIAVRSALDMHREVMARAADCDVFIGVAAVADYRPAATAGHKLKGCRRRAAGDAGGESGHPRRSRRLPRPPFCVGFAAESGNLEEYAQVKRTKKGP